MCVYVCASVRACVWKKNFDQKWKTRERKIELFVDGSITATSSQWEGWWITFRATIAIPTCLHISSSGHGEILWFSSFLSDPASLYTFNSDLSPPLLISLVSFCSIHDQIHISWWYTVGPRLSLSRAWQSDDRRRWLHCGIWCGPVHRNRAGTYAYICVVVK